MKDYWVIWDECGDAVALTENDTSAEMTAMEGKTFSLFSEEPEWFQIWAENTLKII